MDEGQGAAWARRDAEEPELQLSLQAGRLESGLSKPFACGGDDRRRRSRPRRLPGAVGYERMFCFPDTAAAVEAPRDRTLRRDRAPLWKALGERARTAIELAGAFLTLEDGYEAAWDDASAQERRPKADPIERERRVARAPHRQTRRQDIQARRRHQQIGGGSSRATGGGHGADESRSGTRRLGAVTGTPQACVSPLPPASERRQRDGARDGGRRRL